MTHERPVRAPSRARPRALRRRPTVFCAVTAVTATAPCDPERRRRCAGRPASPAPPLESEPGDGEHDARGHRSTLPSRLRGVRSVRWQRCRTTSSSTASSCRAASCWAPAPWPRCTCCARRSSPRVPRSRRWRFAASTRRRTARCTRCSDELGVRVLPNTAGCATAAEAVRDRAARPRGVRHDWVKLEVIGDDRSLLPDAIETVRAAATLVDEGFAVWAYAPGRPRRLRSPGPGRVRGGHAARRRPSARASASATRTPSR